MTYWETVHTETRDGFDIELALAPEDKAPDWDFESEDERQETSRRIDNGDLLWFVARVTAYRHGVPLGTEYLGGCCYDTVQEFLRDGYFEGMVDEAVSEARSTVAAIAAADDDAWEREQSHVRFAESGGHKFN